MIEFFGIVIVAALIYMVIHVYGYEKDHYERHHGKKKAEWQAFKEEHLDND